MNCHEDNKNRGKHKHSPLSHMMHMVICCGLPVVIAGFLPLLARFSPGAGNIVAKMVPFLCPIMMIAMMLLMMGGGKRKDCCNSTDQGTDRE